MRNKYLIRFCKSLNSDFEYTEYRDTLEPYRIVKQYSDGAILEKLIEHFRVKPFGVYQENFRLNDKLIYKSLY